MLFLPPRKNGVNSGRRGKTRFAQTFLFDRELKRTDENLKNKRKNKNKNKDKINH